MKASDGDHVDHGHSPRERGVRALMFHRYRRALGGQKVFKRREDAFVTCPKQPDGAKTRPKCTQTAKLVPRRVFASADDGKRFVEVPLGTSCADRFIHRKRG